MVLHANPDEKVYLASTGTASLGSAAFLLREGGAGGSNEIFRAAVSTLSENSARRWGLAAPWEPFQSQTRPSESDPTKRLTEPRFAGYRRDLPGDEQSFRREF